MNWYELEHEYKNMKSFVGRTTKEGRYNRRADRTTKEGRYDRGFPQKKCVFSTQIHKNVYK